MTEEVKAMKIPVNDNHQRGLPAQLVGRMALSSKLSLALWGAIILFSVINVNKEYKVLTSLFTISDGNLVKLKIPSELDPESTRRLSLNLGGGACQWTVSLSAHKPSCLWCN